MLYRPKLSNGENVPLSWPIAIYRLVNIICWPLEENSTLLAKVFDRFCYIFTFVIFLQHNEAGIRYIRVNFNDMDLVLTGLVTYLVLGEMHLRNFQLGLQKEKFRKFLQKYYAKIYIDESSHPDIYRRIRRQLIPTKAYSFSYLSALLLELVVPILNIIYHRKDILYKMIFPFDHTPTHIYVLLILANIWVGNITVTMAFGEANVLSETILHLNWRYRLLRDDLERNSKMLLQHASNESIARDFQHEVIRILQRNIELNEFAAEFQSFFSYRIFVLLAFAAVLLCTLGFKVYTNVAESVPFAFWMCGKIAELLALGEVGSTLIATTDEVSSMYYHSNWEHIISQSTNTHDNVQMMKLLVVAIETNQKPFQLSGLNFFSISLTAVVTILRGAGSYFTCLISLR